MKIKCIAVMSLLLPSLVIGEVIATTPNKTGGKIVLTNEVCTHKEKVYDSLAYVYTYTQDGQMMEGCYTIDDKFVLVVWKLSNGEIKQYPLKEFILNKNTQLNLKNTI